MAEGEAPAHKGSAGARWLSSRPIGVAVPVLVVCAGVLFLFVGVWELAESVRSLRNTETAQATVESVSEDVSPAGTTYNATLVFTVGGQERRTVFSHGVRGNVPPIGGVVTIVYDPADITTAKALSTTQLWFAGTFFVLFSFVWLGLFGFGLFRKRRLDTKIRIQAGLKANE